MIDFKNIVTTPLIGIIGGTGPEATINIQMHLLDSMKKKLKPLKDQDYYGVIVDNNTQIPDRTIAIENNDESIIQLYIERAKNLENLGVNLIIIACNTAHAFFDKIQNALSIRVLNIVEETVLYFTSNYPNIKAISLLATLGTLNSKIYQNAFARHGIIIKLCDSAMQVKVHQAIYGIKAGYISKSLRMVENKCNLYKIYKSFDNNLNISEVKSPRRIILDALESIKSKQIQHVILGCTELSIIAKHYKKTNQLIDPSKIITESAVKYFSKI